MWPPTANQLQGVTVVLQCIRMTAQKTPKLHLCQAMHQRTSLSSSCDAAAAAAAGRLVPGRLASSSSPAAAARRRLHSISLSMSRHIRIWATLVSWLSRMYFCLSRRALPRLSCSWIRRLYCSLSDYMYIIINKLYSHYDCITVSWEKAETSHKFSHLLTSRYAIIPPEVSSGANKCIVLGRAFTKMSSIAITDMPSNIQLLCCTRST